MVAKLVEGFPVSIGAPPRELAPLSRIECQTSARPAVGTFVILPPILITLVFQKYLLRGLLSGAVKG